MTRIAKLYAWILANPDASIPFRDFERLLRAFGFVCERVRGSHRAYSRQGINRLMVVQPRGKDAKPYQIREFIDIIREYELTLDE